MSLKVKIKDPFSEEDNIDHPKSLYAATKKPKELIAHTHSHLYKLPWTRLRLFTIYVQLGRSDMVPFIFTRAISNKEAIHIFNNAYINIEFTCTDEIIEILFSLLNKPAIPNIISKKDNPDPSINWSLYQLFNIDNGNKFDLKHFIELIETEFKMKAIK